MTKPLQTEFFLRVRVQRKISSFSLLFLFCFVLRISSIAESFVSLLHLSDMYNCYELNTIDCCIRAQLVCYNLTNPLYKRFRIISSSSSSLVLAFHYKKSRNILYVCYFDKHNLNRLGKMKQKSSV